MEVVLMNTDDIRNIVESKIAEETRTNHFSDYYTQNFSTEVAEQLLSFIQQYLRNTPDIMEQAYHAANQVNLAVRYQPIYNATFSYWQEEYDYIPDHVGIVGICDDAYLSLSLMQLIATSVVPSTGTVLIPDFDLKEQNDSMGLVIGAEIKSQLDAVVAATFSSIQVQDSLNDLFAAAMGGTIFGGMAGYGGQMAGLQSMLDQQRIQDDVNIQLGAMGIF